MSERLQWLYEKHRRLLFAIAYRMLGSAMDAEDMVQETFLALKSADPVKLENPRAYLTTIITRLCIDQLRSLRIKREAYIGDWLPEPLITNEDPAEGHLMRESITMAFLVIMENLGALQRAVFILRDVFDYDYAEIARIVDKKEVNCRQIARRARRNITERRHQFEAEPKRQKQLLMRFVKSLSSGDMGGLISLLAEDIILTTDGGGKVNSAINPVYGNNKVARFFLGIYAKAPEGMSYSFDEINSRPGLISYLKGKPQNVVTIECDENSIREIHVVSNPDKLTLIAHRGPLKRFLKNISGFTITNS